MKEFDVLRMLDYTDMPLGRNSKDGPKNGEHYRETVVVPALRASKVIEIDFDGVLGTAPSFLEELFGGLVRKGHISADELRKRVRVKYRYESVKQNIKKYIDEAEAGLGKR